jgi:Na+/phosphate symporter
VNIILKQEAWEFTAKMVGDLGKNILTVGFASYFFKDLPLPVRIIFVIVGIGLILASIVMMSRKGEK